MDSEGVKIPVIVESTGDLGAKAAAGLKDVTVATQAAAAATKEASAATRTFAADSESATVRIKTLSEAEQRRAELVSQRQAITETETEMLAAQAKGETARAQTLEGELGMRREALQIQLASTLNDEQSMQLAQERAASRLVITRQQEAELAMEREITAAQEQLNRQLVEEEALRLRNAELSESQGDGALKGAGLAARRGLGSMLGIGVRGMAGGLPQIAAFIALAEIIKGVTELMHKSEEEAKAAAQAQETAAKATAERFKVLGAAEKESLGVAKAEAEALIKTLDELATTADKSRSRLDKMTDAKAEFDEAKVDEREAGQLAGTSDEVERAKIHAQAEKDRANIRAQAGAEKTAREQQGAQSEVDAATGTRDQAAANVRRAENEAVNKDADFQFFKQQAQNATHDRIAAETKAKQADDAFQRGVAAGRDLSDPTLQAEAAEVGSTKHAADEARAHEKATQADRDDAEVAAHKASDGAAELASALDDLTKRVKEANEKLQIANYKAGAATIKGGTEVAKADQRGAQGITEAEKKAREKTQQEEERQAQAAVAANEEEQKQLHNQIAALELHAREPGRQAAETERDAARIVELKKQVVDLEYAKKVLNKTATEADQGAADVAKAQIIAGEIKSKPASHGLPPGGHPAHHGGGMSAEYVPTDFDAVFHKHIDTRTNQQKSNDGATQQATADNADPVASVIADAESALAASHAGGGNSKLTGMLRTLIEHVKHEAKNKVDPHEVDEMKREIDLLKSQHKNSRN